MRVGRHALVPPVHATKVMPRANGSWRKPLTFDEPRAASVA
jgi:hypothetical protein